MLGSLTLPAIVLLGFGYIANPELITCSGSDAQGRLVNLTAGSAHNAPIDREKPTIVITHGFNPCPRLFQFTFPRTYAQVIRSRWGKSVNVLTWEWNAATFVSLRPSINEANAVEQGRRLASALIARGVRPECTQLIGHSIGCVVMASAAKTLWCSTGQPVARLTLLDPLKSQHGLIFERLQASTAAMFVENLWAPGLSGYGAIAEVPGVFNIRVAGATPIRGAINPARSNHLHVIRWHLDILQTMAVEMHDVRWPWIMEGHATTVSSTGRQ